MKGYKIELGLGPSLEKNLDQFRGKVKAGGDYRKSLSSPYAGASVNFFD